MPEQPSGTVTLVFTDIEGSTRLLHELGQDAYRDGLTEHRRIVREAFARYAGYEVDYEGDAFFYAFASAPAALAAVSEAMSSLEGGPIRIRVGMHTGEPALDPPKYVGLDVHKAARIMGAGHGGQVLLSQSTRELVDAETSDLGEHRLKDFEAPVPLFQLGGERFPPLRTISNTNLPRPASSFVGREAEVAAVVALVRESRLVTLTGPGGTGKTRLAIEAAAELVPEFKAGVFWVGLATLRDPALVVETVAQMLGVKGDLAEHVGERELLLLLDNFEQVVEAAADLSALLRLCPNLSVAVTSRELLRIDGEVEYPVPPLEDEEAVELFTARSRLAADETVSELCRRLDDLPLAVELAAARASVLSPAQILDRLGQHLDLLKGARDADPRQATLRATIEWSFELLPPNEQRLFARLAVFPDFELGAAETVCEADLDTLQSLVEKSLLRHTEERFWMLETIRAFAAERLDESGEGEEVRRRHAEFFLRLAESTCLAVNRVEQGEMRYDVALAEQDNMRAAIDWALGFDPELGMRIAVELEQFWVSRDAPEGMRRLVALYDRAGDIPLELRAAALRVLGGTTQVSGDQKRGRELYEASLVLYEELGDEWGIVHLRHRLATSAVNFGDWTQARSLLEENVVRARTLGSGFLEAEALGMLGVVEDHDGNVEQAAALHRRHVELSREIGFAWFEAIGLANLAELSLKLGRIDEAEDNARASLELCLTMGERRVTVFVFALLAAVSRARGDLVRAGHLWGAVEAEGERATFGWSTDDIDGFGRQVLAEPAPELEAALQAGRRLSFDEAVDYALSVDSRS